jgi:hypothetical protein
VVARTATRAPNLPTIWSTAAFSVAGPDRLSVSDITEHHTNGGKICLAVVLDAWL